MNELRLPGARVRFSTRKGGVSRGPYESLNLGLLTDDDPDHVLENRRRLASEAGLAPSNVAMGWQVHGAEARVDRSRPIPGTLDRGPPWSASTAC